VAFDILALNGTDTRKEPLVVRKQQLFRTLDKTTTAVACVDSVEQEGELLFEIATKLSLEGVMAKRSDSVYKAGRTRNWLKIKTAIGKEREGERC